MSHKTIGYWGQDTKVSPVSGPEERSEIMCPFSGPEARLSGFPSFRRAWRTRLARPLNPGHADLFMLSDAQSTFVSGPQAGRKPKLTPHQRREAIKRRASGEQIRDIARSYNVHNSTISRLAA